MTATLAAPPPSVAAPPFRPLRARAPALDLDHRADGTLLLRCPYPLKPVENDILHYLDHWAEVDGERVLLAERDAQRQWRRISFAAMRDQSLAIGQALLDRGLTPGSTLLILSENSIEHAVMMLGAMRVGVVVAPISPSYSLLSQDHDKLRHVAGLVAPRMVFAQDGRRYARALAALVGLNAEIVVVEGSPEGIATTPFADLAATTPGAAVAQAYAQIRPDTVAKILFTSGSTGFPKGVINTQYMMCANQAMSDSLWDTDDTEPPIMLSWLPWNHTMGGNALVNRALRLGGTLHIDDGRPTPDGFARTIENLREVSPTSFANVPAAFAMLADAMERDDDLRERFFRRLESLSYAAASLPNELWQRLQRLAVASTGMRIPFTSGYGATETAPLVSSLYWITQESGVIGLPPPGIELKLVPAHGDRYELRVRGGTVTPGYYRQPELTRQAFDDEGFYGMGDAVSFVDPQDPLQGLRFAGRVKEDFKLATGTWVATTALRMNVLDATMPCLRDVVIAGHDRSHLALLAWPNPAQAADPGLAERVAQALRLYNASHPGSSTRIARFLLLEEPADMDAGEITDKGYVNQGAVLARRAALVEALYADPPAAGVTVL